MGSNAQPLAVVHRGQRLAVDSWGAGPVVLMVHGCNGRGAQLGAFAPIAGPRRLSGGGARQWFLAHGFRIHKIAWLHFATTLV